MADRFRAPILTGEELPRWLFVDMNSYFASVEQQVEPSLRGRAIIVVPVMSDTTCAIAASYEAKAFGVKTGTNVGEAKRMCPGLRLVPARHEIYLDYHHRIIDEVERHLHVTKVCSIDEAACLLMGDERQPEKALRLGRAIKDGIRKNVGTALKCSVGLAPTRFLAKVASDLQKPDGLTLLRTSDLPGPLLKMAPMDFPGIGRRMNIRLARLGIDSTQKLFALSRRDMRAAWGGAVGERFWYDLHGFDVPDKPTQKGSIGHSHVLAPNLRAPAMARLVARRLLLKAASRLRRDEYCTGALTLSLRLVTGQRVANDMQLSPTCDSLVLVRALDRLWADLMKESGPVHIRKAGVVLHRLQPGAAPPPDLFTWNLEAKAQGDRLRGARLSAALDTLNARYGRETVTLGSKLLLPKDTGVKIAFTRIPERAEFRD